MSADSMDWGSLDPHELFFDPSSGRVDMPMHYIPFVHEGKRSVEIQILESGAFAISYTKDANGAEIPIEGPSTSGGIPAGSVPQYFSSSHSRTVVSRVKIQTKLHGWEHFERHGQQQLLQRLQYAKVAPQYLGCAVVFVVNYFWAYGGCYQLTSYREYTFRRHRSFSHASRAIVFLEVFRAFYAKDHTVFLFELPSLLGVGGRRVWVRKGLPDVSTCGDGHEYMAH
ncbi:hypothetical protein JB92DRAFT_2832923 [Gautieria morchelliformis]|nr:hypothetical protein JB92DRAFT_2832923 [Gautieria morchelliformis]